MTIFYFTSTGNCLSVAKRIGGTLISIPQVINNDELEYSDDVIGIVFPVYGFFIPKMVRAFLAKAKLSADYILRWVPMVICPAPVCATCRSTLESTATTLIMPQAC